MYVYLIKCERHERERIDVKYFIVFIVYASGISWHIYYFKQVDAYYFYDNGAKLTFDNNIKAIKIKFM